MKTDFIKKYALGATIIALLLVLIFMNLGQSKTAYVNINEAFEQFEYTKKLKSELSLVKNARQKKLDSLSFEIKVMAEKLSTGNNGELNTVFQVKRKEFLQMEEMFNQENVALTDKYDNQIHKQLSTYIREFGKDKGYDFVLGTEELGAVLYAKEKNNVTKDVVAYINKKYSGKI